MFEKIRSTQCWRGRGWIDTFSFMSSICRSREGALTSGTARRQAWLRKLDCSFASPKGKPNDGRGSERRSPRPWANSGRNPPGREAVPPRSEPDIPSNTGLHEPEKWVLREALALDVK